MILKLRPKNWEVGPVNGSPRATTSSANQIAMQFRTRQRPDVCRTSLRIRMFDFYEVKTEYLLFRPRLTCACRPIVDSITIEPEVDQPPRLSSHQLHAQKDAAKGTVYRFQHQKTWKLQEKVDV
jgi:hypothetical protein